MTVFVYESYSHYREGISQPVEIIANTPFVFSREKQMVKFDVCNKVIELKFYDYEFVKDRLLLWKEA